MSNYTQSITADGSYKIANAYRRCDANNYECTLFAYAPTTGGAWGGGSVAWKASYDGGDTLVPITDLTGISITQTSDMSFKCYIDTGTVPENGTQIYAVLTGATNPVLSIGLCDNT